MSKMSSRFNSFLSRVREVRDKPKERPPGDDEREKDGDRREKAKEREAEAGENGEGDDTDLHLGEREENDCDDDDAAERRDRDKDGKTWAAMRSRLGGAAARGAMFLKTKLKKESAEDALAKDPSMRPRKCIGYYSPLFLCVCLSVCVCVCVCVLSFCWCACVHCTVMSSVCRCALWGGAAFCGASHLLL